LQGWAHPPVTSATHSLQAAASAAAAPVPMQAHSARLPEDVHPPPTVFCIGMEPLKLDAGASAMPNQIQKGVTHPLHCMHCNCGT
jgi:hypothetical protein